ncbi:6-bladed beta-propeller [Desulfitobacterium metallireducens]|uniref:6-bladed beta-propeller n=1 Tax=Desulfitobacterium metallireducens TaxID=142877 RepID=UPI001FA7D743|nr:6-bladed beta-propeller [Desulfitobacterium metallireducens]
MLAGGRQVVNSIFSGKKALAESSESLANATRPPQFLYEFNGSNQKFKSPLAVTTSTEGKIFVADTGHSQIQVLSSRGEWEKDFGRGSLVYPTGLAFFEQKLYVSDPQAQKIFIYQENGEELPALLEHQRLILKDGKPGQFIRPSNIQVSSDHLFYITDIANQCVVVLDQQGKILRSFGSPGTADGQFNYPNALFIDKDNKIYVSDSNNARLQIFNSEGEFLTKITGSNGKLGAMTLPRGVAVNDQGQIYVVDVFSNSVRVYDETGYELWVLGGMGSNQGQFNFPNGICIDNKGLIYITDRENNRIQVFGYK